MNSTNDASLAVFSSAWFINFLSKRLRLTAKIKAPKAPMAPPSVGVATPKKMVPKTKKIRIRGGISTKVTCSAKRDNKPIRVTLFTRAKLKATKEAMVMDMITTSSPGDSCVRSSQAVMMASCDEAQAKPATVHTTKRNIKDT